MNGRILKDVLAFCESDCIPRLVGLLDDVIMYGTTTVATVGGQ